jgi:hypothetical protein
MVAESPMNLIWRGAWMMISSQTREVVDVVDLVEDHIAHPLQPLRVLINKVAQDLRRHHHHRRQWVDGVLPGDEADITVPVASPIIAVLLVRERLQRRGVDGAPVGLQGAEDRVVGDDRLARAGWCRDEHPVMGLEFLDRLDLERIERPRQRGLKGIDQRPG